VGEVSSLRPQIKHQVAAAADGAMSTGATVEPVPFEINHVRERRQLTIATTAIPRGRVTDHLSAGAKLTNSRARSDRIA
jgi:hypothetical protein